MSKLLKLTVITIALVVLTVSLSSCGSKGPKKADIIGHWETYTTVINFNPDGTHSRSSGGNLQTGPVVGEGSWSIDGNTVKTYTDKYGYIDYTYEDGKLKEGDNVFVKK